MTIQTTSLSNIAPVIRSKNAGPYLLTFDVMFKNFEDFESVWQAGDFTKEKIAQQFGIDTNKVVSIFSVPRGHAIKLTIRRPLTQGTVGESDMYGCQQHAPLLNFSIHLKT